MGNYIGAGLQSILSGYLIKRGADGSATLLGHTFDGGYTLDYLAVFWIGCAALSVVLTIAAVLDKAHIPLVLFGYDIATPPHPCRPGRSSAFTCESPVT